MANLSFLKNFGSKLLDVAPQAAGLIPGFGPAVGAILNLAIPAIKHAASKDISGPDKKAEVLQTLERAAPEIGKLLPPDAIKDHTKFTEGASALVEALLDLMKSTGDVPSTPTPISIEVPQPALSVVSNLDTNSNQVPPGGVYKVIGTLTITQ